ncbi:outer membrane lipoprotein-sorting protein [Candidatus Riflebacteria bacterium]
MRKKIFACFVIFSICNCLLAQDNNVSDPALATALEKGLHSEQKVSATIVASASKKLDAKEILSRIDDNIFSDTVKARSRMVVVNRRGRKRVMKLLSWQEGDQKAFSEYLAPRKEKGTKMLKVGKNLWTYSPRTDRIIHIAGHLLRQSVMGSDLSYEDSMEEIRLEESYKASIEKETTYEQRKVWILSLDSIVEGMAYPKRKLWVDRERFLPLREERFGKSGRLLKTLKIKEMKRIQGRWYPTNMLFKDELKSGKGTEFIMDEIEFNPELPKNVFSKSNLRR